MKRIAIGRKNWLFVGSEKGGQTAAVLASFTSTCHRLGVEPWAYLQDVLTRLPTTPAGQPGALPPDHWQAACRANTATPPGHPTTSGAKSSAPIPYNPGTPLANRVNFVPPPPAHGPPIGPILDRCPARRHGQAFLDTSRQRRK